MKHTTAVAVLCFAFLSPAHAADNEGASNPPAKTSEQRPRTYVESFDENDLRWLYQPPTAKFADPERLHPYVGFRPGESTGVSSAKSKVEGVERRTAN